MPEQSHVAFTPDPRLDFLADIEPVTGWSENMFFQQWDEKAGIGLFTHIGRVREDPTLWRGCIAVYLPGGQLLVQRSYGRAADDRGPQAGSLKIICETAGKRWRLLYDGVAELTHSRALGARLGGASTARPMKLDLAFEARSPTYDLFAARELGQQDFAHLHHEQAFNVVGELRFDGGVHSLSGFGFRDHSVGARNLSDFSGNTMFYASFPSGRVVQALQNFTADGGIRLRSGFLVENGVGELLDLVEAPGLTDTCGAPDAFEVHYLRNGQPIKVTGQALHAATFTIGMPNDWSIGTDRESDNPLIIVEQPCRVLWPDGEVGYGNLERNFRRDILEIPG